MRTLAVVVILFFTALPLPSNAEENTVRATDLWDRGMVAWSEGDREGAMELLERSFQLEPLGRTACMVGRVARERGWRATAHFWYTQCRDDEEIDDETRARAVMELRHLRSASGAVIVLNEEFGAMVVVDGAVSERPLSRSYRELLLDPGAHELELTSVGGEPLTETVEVHVEAGESLRIELPELGSGGSEGSPRRWPLWMMLGTTLVLGAGFGAAIGLEARYTDELGNDEAHRAMVAAGILGSLTAIGLASVIAMLPYLLGSRRRLTSRLRGSVGWLASLATERTKD